MRTNTYTILATAPRLLITGLGCLFILITGLYSSASALPIEQYRVLASGAKYFNIANDCSTGGPTPTTSSTAGSTLTNVDISTYSPVSGGDAMEGGYASSKPGPDGQSLVRTLDDVREKTSTYVTLAGNPTYYNKQYTIPTITYKDKNGVDQTLSNIKAVVHDTGGAFKNSPEGRYDLAVGKDYPDNIMNSEPYNGKGKIQLIPSSGATTTSGGETPTSTAASCCATGSSSGGAVGSGELMAFASLPITSTWNVSDSTAEQWFLKQAGARATKTKYGLNDSNIGGITTAIKGAGVSPVFFYAYTVNEGGGAGGFINHYRGDTGGGGVGNAKRDAEYLASQSKVMNSKPSWIDAGNPVDFVPKDVKDSGNASFQSMPAGTIGRAYIPATAATTWEVYYPDGLKKEFNRVQNYGAPLSATMQNVQKMGGDPSQGGATVSATGGSDGCSGNTTVAGEGMEKAINWAKKIAESNAYGYNQDTRTTGWEKWQSDPSCTDQCGSFDCSSFISAALTMGGFFEINPNFNTGNEVQSLEQAKFTKAASSAATSEGLQAGDILIASGRHTAMYIGNNQMVEAVHDENHHATGGAVGDQKGDEIAVNSFRNDSWNSVYRAPN